MLYQVMDSNMFLISSLLGEDFHIDEYFSNGLKPPTSVGIGLFSRDRSPAICDGFAKTPLLGNLTGPNA